MLINANILHMHVKFFSSAIAVFFSACYFCRLMRFAVTFGSGCKEGSWTLRYLYAVTYVF
jgi:hypothetical protein